MTFEVSFKSKAHRDINKEASYQHHKSGTRAELRWVGEMDRAEAMLAIDPHRYPQADEAEELVSICGNWSSAGNGVPPIVFCLQSAAISLWCTVSAKPHKTGSPKTTSENNTAKKD